MVLNKDIIELSQYLTREQLAEYILRLKAAERQFKKDTKDIHTD